MRLAYYAGASTAAAAACLLNAFHHRPNYYSATVYLSQSNACLLILTNLLLVIACSFMYGLQRLLYGRLRPIEIEQLSEKAWYAVLDTLLAIPNFREDVGGWLLTMFVLLLAGKVWGWIGEGRVDILEQQPPANPRLFHARLSTSLVLSVVFDVMMMKFCVETVMADPRPGMMVIFTFEFAVLTVFSSFTLLRYGLSVIQAEVEKVQMKEAIEVRKKEIKEEREASRRTAEQNEDTETPAPLPPTEDEPIEVDENEVDVPGWEAKRRYLFGLEVFTDFLKLIIYIVFFTVSVTFNGLPMHIMRDVYMTFASFSKRVSDYVAYRQATSDMNTRYPDATTEEIRGDACIVCRENMVAWEQPAGVQGEAQPAAPRARRDEGLRAKKLPCNHILHLRCLKAWLERQQVCPTCRRPVITPQTSTQRPAGAGAGAAPPQPGRPAQHLWRNRARIFNFGPVRVGFLNGGQAGQIDNIIDQMRNPQAAAGQANAAGAATAANHGPNHLGLQVPYGNALAGQQGVPGAPGARAAVPVQIQLMQMEQRLMQEAHNLGVEQQQLSTLRYMEAELARLRAAHVPANAPLGTATATQRQQAALAVQPGMQVPLPPFGMPLFPQPMVAPQAPEVMQGSHDQQLADGAEGLPQGMVLPEGWTVMPLHRTDAPAGLPHLNLQPGDGQRPQTQTSQPPIQTTTNIPSAATTAEQPAAQEAGQTTASNAAAGPTDDRGSPLFTPSTAPPRPNEAPPQSETMPSPEATQQPQQREQKAPWNGGEGWSFDGQNGDATTNGHAPENPREQSNGAEQQIPDGKGKGRAVEVEDVPDE